MTKLLPWNWPVIRRFQPKSTTGKLLWYTWWGLTALPGPGPAWWIAIWIAYESGYEKEIETMWLVVTTTVKFVWNLLTALF
jgi:hypothetical protein